MLAQAVRFKRLWPVTAVLVMGLLLWGRPVLAQGPEWTWQNPLPQGNDLIAVWGSSDSDVYAVGGSGTILHYDGRAWSAMSSSTDGVLLGVWGSSGSDVYAVGLNGTILHYDGSAWSAMHSGTSQTLRGVWGSSDSDVFAVGYWGTILHYDGSTWSEMSSGTGVDL